MIGLIAVIAAIAAPLGYQALHSSSSDHSDSSEAAASPPSRTASPSPSPDSSPSLEQSPAPPRDSRGEPRGAVGKTDGVVPDGTTVFDDGVPAVSHLTPELLKALRRAATDASGGGVAFYVNSGWRSPRYQDQLLRRAVAEYGSEEEAARWVATAKTSSHVSGDAVDIGRTNAATWLSEHGAAYGLCQIYRNEPWHFELRSEAVAHGCPRMYADPTQDPRMQQ
ncbi:M15 family metallopeptidase [Streptomyces sp. NPDC050095]|uniref:M15 family metallopeptidase n=1 Tax=unclassified Streptomyces TaxID=2593676 RepID=UPI003432F179